MKLDISDHSLPVYEALASSVRITIIQLLSKNSMNIKELAEALNLSSAIMTKHVKKLENAGLVRSEMIPGKGGLQKKCLLNEDYIEIIFPTKKAEEREFMDQEVSVGHFTDFQINPTCGLATQEKIIGEFDEPRYFLDPERVNAKILWFGHGYVEYKIANFLHSKHKAEELDISMEISSEAPFTNDNWPSDITFYLNNVELGKWTSPGDFGDQRGKYTPSWWPSVINQYGLLKHLRVNEKGTFMDGNWLSDVTIKDIHIENKQWTFRISVEQDSVHVGGVTLFGKGFGNYNQDLLFRLYYS
ncbi:helix-turn-helix domain-containing protein [Pullulanibacillus sp. KACC 23026]|uniref:ArsR/SmtB family transcription factor n=1 Tax=Pullulanibacillus sp. KACC 23026 TaxID=3028315 RepID=UPI0023B06E8E|nr:ArsR family transcriptional regulator [Pullulanibacillus sp. KACC 23026]WEG11090.1 helix-turn-helix domain-containing protein [Pullulanibacillus sp. KACC 23026]